MAYPNPPMNVAGTYQQGQTIRQTNIDAAATIEQFQRRSDKMYLTEKARLTNIGMSIFGDTMKKMSEDIAYATGGYLLDQNIQMKKLDVAAAVQERLSDEAVSAGALISFDPGPNPDQAIDEVQEISNRSKAAQGIPAGREGTTYAGPPVPKTGEDGSEYAGPPEDPSAMKPSVKTGQDAQQNLKSVKERGASWAQRPKPPKRQQHTRIGTTEIYGNPTTGGMYARTSKGLVVPITEGTFRNLINLQQSNAEIHAFNQMANYEHSLAKWTDALTAEHLASQQAIGEHIIDGHIQSGVFDEAVGALLRDAVASGVGSEELIDIINSMKKKGMSAGLDELAKIRSNVHKGRAAHHKGVETDTKKQLVEIDKQIQNLDPTLESERRQIDELRKQRIGIQISNDRARYNKGIRDNLGAFDSYIPRSIAELDESTVADMFNLAIMGAGVLGNSEAERQAAFSGLLRSSGVETWAAKTLAEFKYLHETHGLVYNEDSERRFLDQIGRYLSPEDKVSQELMMRKFREDDKARSETPGEKGGPPPIAKLPGRIDTQSIGKPSFFDTPQGSFFKTALEQEHADAQEAFDALYNAGMKTYGSQVDISAFPIEVQDMMYKLMQEFEPVTNTED